MALLWRIPKEYTPTVQTILTVVAGMYVVPAVVYMIVTSPLALGTFGTVMLAGEIHRRRNKK